MRVRLALVLLLSSCALEVEGVKPAKVRETAIESGAVKLRWKAANQLAAAGWGTCAVLGEARELHCWGGEVVQFRPDGKAVQTPCPKLREGRSCARRPLPMGLRDAVQVILARHGGCALRADGETTCWRSYRTGCADCGVPRQPRMSRPVRVPELEGAVRLESCRWSGEGWFGVMPEGPIAVAGSCDHDPDDWKRQQVGNVVDSLGARCERHEDGTVWCRGSHEFGQLGVGDGREAKLSECKQGMMEKRWVAPCSKQAVRVPGLEDVTQLAAGQGFRTCAVVRDGSLFCWGQWDGAWQVDPRWLSPQRMVGLDRTRRVAMGRKHLCALDEQGTVRCLGSNRVGQLGDRSFVSRDEPQRVPLPRPATELAAGSEHTCAVLDDHSLYCWGENVAGQLGDGSDETRPSPVQTLPPGSVAPQSKP